LTLKVEFLVIKLLDKKILEIPQQKQMILEIVEKKVFSTIINVFIMWSYHHDGGLLTSFRPPWSSSRETNIVFGFIVSKS